MGSQTLTVTQNVYDHADGSLATNAIMLSNVIVGYTGSVDTTVGISNASGFRVDLDATNVAGSGSTNLTLAGVSGLIQGSSSNAAITFAAGQGTGTYSNDVTITFSDASGMLGASTNLGSQTITLTQNVYDHASGSLSTNAVSLGDVIVGYSGSLSNSLVVSNAAGLRVDLATTNDASGALTLGNVTNLAAGSNAALAVTVANGQGTGTYSNDVTVTFADASDLLGASTNLGSSSVAITANIYDHASGSLATNSIVLSNVIVGYGSAVATNVGLTNAEGFRVALEATNIVTGSTNLTMDGVGSLTAGSGTTTALTFAAGQGTGTYSNDVTVTFADASGLNGASTNLGSQTLTVTQNVYDHASNSLTDTTIILSNAIVGFNTAISTNLAIINAAGFRVDLMTVSTNANINLSISDISTLQAGSNALLGFTLSTNQGVGAFTNQVTVISADDSTLLGATTNATNTVTVSGAIYDHASNSLSTNSVVLQAVHVDYTNAQTNLIGMSNAAGFRVAMLTAATNSSNSLSLTGVTGVANGVSSNAILTFSIGQGVGAFTNQIEVVYGDDSSLDGAVTAYGTNTLTVSGLVYSGQSTWTAGSGNWTTFTNWSALGGTPGLDGLLSTNDTATFGAGSGGVVTLNTNAALNALSFSNASAYTIAGTGTISLVQGSSSPSITTTLGTHAITTALGLSNNVTVTNATGTMLTLVGNITGAGGFTKTGQGTLTLTTDNSYSGGTTINSGTLKTAHANALGSGQVTLNAGMLSLQSILNIDSLVWTNSAATIAISNIGSVGGSYLNVSNSVTLSGTTNSFDLSGAALGSSPSMIFSYGTNVFSTNQFAISNFDPASYTLSVSNVGSLNSLWIALSTLPVPSNGTNSVSGTNNYPSMSFGTNSTLVLLPGSETTINTNVVVTNNSTVDDNGNLIVPSLTVEEGSTLMGVGTVTLTGGNLDINGKFAPGNSPGTFFVTGGNLVMGATGVWDEQIYSASVYDRVVVTGSAFLNGTMNITTFGSGGLQYGEKLNFLTASGGITGAFSSITAPEGFRGRLLISGTEANILIAPASYTQLAEGQNQTQVATALNSFIPATSGDQQVVSTSLDSLTTSDYNEAFNAIMPTMYQSMATIAFNQANAQNMELVQRLWGLRVAEGGGFSMSGFADNTPMLEGQGDGKGVLDSKKDILRPGADNHWGMFVDANGIFANANSGNMLPGYNSESGGVTTGLTYKWNESFASGIYCGYEGTYSKMGAAGSGLGTGSRLIDNAVRFGVFGTYGHKDGKGLYANALAGGAYHNYQATRVIQYTGMNRTANSTPGAGELDTMLATGYDIQKGKFTFGPTASLQYTYLGVNPVNETGAQSLNFNSGGWNSSSMLSSVGAHAAYNWQAGKNVVVVPQISLNWQHEFLQNPYNITGNLGGTSPTFSNTSATGIRDYLYTGVGFTVEFSKKWNTSFFYNAAAGNNNLTSQNIFWSAGVKF